MNKQQNKISIWGEYPPPFGGLSIHIQREAQLLSKDGTLDKVYYFRFNQKRLGSPKFEPFVIPIKLSLRYTILEYLKGLIIFIFTNKCTTVHFHNSLEGAWLIQFMNRILKKKVIITIHDQMRIPRLPESFSHKYILVNSLFKNKRIKWIAVNDRIKEQLIGKGVNSDSIEVIPAYLKATNNIALPDQLLQFKQKHSPLLSTYAYATNLYNGVDLYGIDMSIELLNKLKEQYPDIGLIICIPGRKDKEMIEKYHDMIERYELQNFIYFQYKELHDCASLWGISDLYLRPTNTDGDSVAIREALDVSCVAITSNCTTRPKGCVVFKDRDLNDYYINTSHALKHKKELVDKIPQSNDFYPLLYKTLFGHERK